MKSCFKLYFSSGINTLFYTFNQDVENNCGSKCFTNKFFTYNNKKVHVFEVVASKLIRVDQFNFFQNLTNA
jgi:hypothetical protein